ncbi:uncharacterized protein [Arachis hypogaea]|nr:uncharacterized protein LOC114924625 [Arachis hypogaea]
MVRSTKIHKRLVTRIIITAVGKVGPHRLVVQDISPSRRQREFDFPWG